MFYVTCNDAHVALFVLSLCPYDISVGVWAFVIGLSQISSFFSFNGNSDITHHIDKDKWRM